MYFVFSIYRYIYIYIHLYIYVCVCLHVCVHMCGMWVTKPVIYIYIYIHTRMLRTILIKSWRQHHTKQQLYGHLPPIKKTIKVRRTRYAGLFWRSRDKLIRDVLLWTSSHARAKAGRPARIYLQQLCVDTGCSSEDLPEAINDREEWREESGISMLIAPHDGYIYIYIYNVFNDLLFIILWSNKITESKYNKNIIKINFYEEYCIK